MLKSENLTFRTVFKPIKQNFDINYKSPLMFIGSCFTENIGELLSKYKFNIDINPFGISYNPMSVYNSINILINEKQFSEQDIFYHNEQWHSFSHHSKFSDSDREQTLNGINYRIAHSSIFLKDTDYLFITFGTSWVYENIETGDIVSNCHKIPSKKFKRRLVKPDEIISVYNILFKKLKQFNENLKIIFTISPVRHIKDGLSENNLSKSILRFAIEELINTNENCSYFPAFELLMDDLRDYRFYKSDLLHPNEQAIDYIFNYFKNSYFSDETFQVFDQIKKVLRAIQHRPFNVDSLNYLNFKENNIKLIRSLRKRYDYIDFKEELLFFNKK